MQRELYAFTRIIIRTTDHVTNRILEKSMGIRQLRVVQTCRKTVKIAE